jgi:hypothetical protein
MKVEKNFKNKSYTASFKPHLCLKKEVEILPLEKVIRENM